MVKAEMQNTYRLLVVLASSVCKTVGILVSDFILFLNCVWLMLLEFMIIIVVLVQY